MYSDITHEEWVEIERKKIAIQREEIVSLAKRVLELFAKNSLTEYEDEELDHILTTPWCRT